MNTRSLRRQLEQLQQRLEPTPEDPIITCVWGFEPLPDDAIQTFWGRGTDPRKTHDLVDDKQEDEVQTSEAPAKQEDEQPKILSPEDELAHALESYSREKGR